MKFTKLTYLWLVRFAYSQGFVWGSRGILELEWNIYITTSDISIFEKWHFVSEPEKIKLKFKEMIFT